MISGEGKLICLKSLVIILEVKFGDDPFVNVFTEFRVSWTKHFCALRNVNILQKEVLSDLDSLISLSYNLLENENTNPVLIFVDAVNQVM